MSPIIPIPSGSGTYPGFQFHETRGRQVKITFALDFSLA
jgi:hypothetical protein